MKTTIEQTLSQLEKEHHIRILYAIESGSRAWGFASPDSDYDVRYIYIRPKNDYLRLDAYRDTIEGPLDQVLDFSGWDLTKTLSLLRKTNPSLMEWAGSPVVYRTTPAWEALSARFPEFFQVQPNMRHYLSMTEGGWKRHLQEERVRLKKYLYVLRPLLCFRWLEKFGTVPPVPFDLLCREVLPEELKEATADLLRRKMAAEEKELAAHIPELDAFILAELPRMKEVLSAMPQPEAESYDKLNAMFLDTLKIWDT